MLPRAIIPLDGYLLVNGIAGMWRREKGSAEDLAEILIACHRPPVAAISAHAFLILINGYTMAIERTFSILKPDVTRRNLTGAVNALIEKAGLRIVAQKRVSMTRGQAETFYGVHRERPFFGELVDTMTSGPVVVQVLEADNAIKRYRDVMGATNPANAEPGTIRKEFAVSIGENSAHGSDAAETAVVEIAQWFAENEIVG